MDDTIEWRLNTNGGHRWRGTVLTLMLFILRGSRGQCTRKTLPSNRGKAKQCEVFLGFFFGL